MHHLGSRGRRFSLPGPVNGAILATELTESDECRFKSVKISSNWPRGWDLMLNYPNLTKTLQGLRPPLTEVVVTSTLAPRLVETWLNDYGRVTGEYDVVETRAEGF